MTEDPIIFPYNHDNVNKEDKKTGMTPLMIAVNHDWLHIIRSVAGSMNKRQG